MDNLNIGSLYIRIGLFLKQGALIEWEASNIINILKTMRGNRQ